MITCDYCPQAGTPEHQVKGHTGPVFEAAIIVEKYEAGKKSAKRAGVKRRRIIKVSLEICDPCLTKLMKRLGQLKARKQLTNEAVPFQVEKRVPINPTPDEQLFSAFVAGFACSDNARNAEQLYGGNVDRMVAAPDLRERFKDWLSWGGTRPPAATPVLAVDSPAAGG